MIQQLLQLSSVLFIDQDVSVSSLRSVHVLHRLIDFVLHGPLNNPRVDVLLGSEGQHLPDLARRADTSTTEVDVGRDDVERGDLWERSLGSTDEDEMPTLSKHGKVTLKRHMFVIWGRKRS